MRPARHVDDSAEKEIEFELLQIDARLAEAQARLAQGNTHEKVEAAGVLDFLKHQKLGLETRLANLDELPAGPWNSLRQ